ncbi:hypothetical protein O181_065600 [Austropuccinia psidii MF-1]|uniref:Uncharacterized protein n=1 Tax=Austropuccinia psidii MF-1 TaxID=1389203 RepID=A0A9Q3EMI3_9BASI|nr:hypothetical protein [Austropuccinia psidii MF-1]
MFVCCPPLPTTWPEEFSLRTRLWSTMMKPYPSTNGHRDPKQANGNDYGRLALSPQVLICPPPLLGHNPMVTSLLDLSKVIIRPMKDGNEKKNPNPPQQDSPIPSLPHEQTPRQPTPGPSGTQRSEELFREPSRTKEPPIPGPSPHRRKELLALSEPAQAEGFVCEALASWTRATNQDIFRMACHRT